MLAKIKNHFKKSTITRLFSIYYKKVVEYTTKTFVFLFFILQNFHFYKYEFVKLCRFITKLLINMDCINTTYTRAKVFGFITKQERFRTGFMLPFTHAATNPIVNLFGFVPCPETLNSETLNPETLNPETFVATSYPETLNPEKTRVNGFP